MFHAKPWLAALAPLALSLTAPFPAPCLGGRAEPVDDALAKSTGQVLEGADRIGK